jgi:hypothetical protein
MLRFSFTVFVPITLVAALICLAGCDLASIADIVNEPAKAEEDNEWGPFRMGMSLDEVQKIIKAKTGKQGLLMRMPGGKWDTMLFEDKMLMLMDGVLLTVMAEDGNIPEDPAVGS